MTNLHVGDRIHINAMPRPGNWIVRWVEFDVIGFRNGKPHLRPVTY